VLTHTSGIPDQDADVLRRERPTAARMLEIVCEAPLRFEPGSRYEYCSSSFYLLAEAMARQVGRPFPEALRELVLDPAGMVDTSFDPRHGRRRIVPVEGVPLGNRLVRELVLRFLARATLPGGGLWGTASDILRFGRMLLPVVTATGAGLLSQQAVDEMTREQTAGICEISAEGVERDPRYALGWGKAHPEGALPSVVAGTGGGPVTVPASAGTFTHGGATGTRLWVDPDRDLVFVFLTNLWGADDRPMFATLAEVYRAFDAG
jgi:CubicO group peptidase (beta-lactamase class C family)